MMIHGRPLARVVGVRLAAWREVRGLSLSETARVAGITKSYLKKLEDGGVENPGMLTVGRIARALQVSLSDLLEGSAHD